MDTCLHLQSTVLIFVCEKLQQAIFHAVFLPATFQVQYGIFTRDRNISLEKKKGRQNHVNTKLIFFPIT